jgi:ATP/maltotriose-dependent transcriptional regulator MalT/DNA-binding SARP family transcriptional activator
VTGRSPLQPSTIGRPALEQRLDDALEARRLTCVVAGPGFGKTTLLSHWAETTPHAMSAWHGMTAGDRTLSALVRAVTDALRLCVPGLPADLVTAVSGPRGPDTGTDEAGRAQAYAGRICAAVAAARPRPLVLVLDDVEMLDSAPSVAFLAALCRQASPPLHIVVASRGDTPFAVARLRGQGLLAELSAADLAFTADETTEVLAGALAAAPGDTDAAPLAAEVHAVTAGWPAAVRLASEALARVEPAGRGAALDRLRRPGGVVHDYLADEVIAGEPQPSRDLLVRLAVLDRFTPELAEALGPGDPAVLGGLVRRGLVVDAPGRGRSWLRVNAVLREVVAASPAARDVRAPTLEAAARWFGEHDQPAAALRCSLAAGPEPDPGRLVTGWGPALLQSGEADVVLDAVTRVPDADRSPEIHRLEGDARQLVGDWDAAVACYERAAADTLGPLGAGLAWRWGLIHHLRGDLDTALAVYGRGALDEDTAAEGPADALTDQALLACWTATAHWLRGDADRCRDLAAGAMARARRSADDRALAAAHTVLALVAAHDGDRLANDTHYLRALDHAERAGDVLQIIRIRLNRGSRLNEEGFHDEAIAELDLAIGLADLGGYGSFKAIALCNRGEARGALGRFDEALDDVQSSKAIFQRMGSLLVSYPLGQAGDLHAARGQTALAYAAYSEAVDVARRSGDLQGLVPALGGLARLLAADDPERARALADEAVAASGGGLGETGALLAQAWVAHAAGDVPRAREIAARAAAVARERRDRAAVAEAVELRAALADGDDDTRAALAEALTLWEELAHPLGQGRTLLALARLGGPGSADHARRAERLLRPLGARRLATAAATLASAAPAAPPLAVQCLGGFAVLRDGMPVPVGEWKSRKARDLVKILIARGGRPVHRETLLELLWPDDAPAQTASRLSVALSTARAVVDPGKRHPPGWYLGADNDTLWIDGTHADIDVDRFHELADRAVTERKAGPSPAATDALAAAEAAYVGDVFPEDPYEDWTVSLRERTRAAYIWVARTLADDSVAIGDPATGVRCYLRVLEHDSYDEHAHLGLVRAHLDAGQQGEARRAYQAYGARMSEIGVEAAPFPAPVTAPGSGSASGRS